MTVEQIVPVPHVRQFVREIEVEIGQAEQSDDIGNVRGVLASVRGKIKSFIEGLTGSAPETDEEARVHVESLTHQLKAAQEHEHSIVAELDDARAKIAAARDATFAAEREVVEIEGKLREARSRLAVVQNARDQIAGLRERFEEEIREGITLIGAAIHGWDKSEIPQGALSEDRSVQEKRRREIERLKIKIEESGIGNGDAVVEEFNNTKERDEFFGERTH